MKSAAATVAIALLTAPVLCAAQPARDANIWNGTAHEIPAPAVANAEHGAGVALPAPREQQQTREVEQMEHQLVQQHQGK